MRKGLTVLEFLIVVVIVALLIAVLLPVLGPRHGRPLRTLCMANLKQQVMAFSVYATEYAGRWPASTVRLESLCDQTPETRDALTPVNGFAIEQKKFYCPSNTSQDAGKLWSRGGISTFGYVWFNERGSSGGVLSPLPSRSPPLKYYASMNTRGTNPSLLEIALDAVVSDTSNAAANFTAAIPAIPFGTSHLNGKQPGDVNIAFLDGHVESKKFDRAKAAAIANAAGGYVWVPNP